MTMIFKDVHHQADKEHIRRIAEELDAHRKRVQAQHPGLTLTGMYNVLEKLRHDEPLTPKDKLIHDQGLVSLLQQLHDDLDAAVFAAYGWHHLWQARQEAQTGTLLDFRTNLVTKLNCEPEAFTAAVAAWERTLDAEILQRLVHLNAQRADEEKRGIIHWLRPEYQSKGPGARSIESEEELPLKSKKSAKAKSGSKPHAPSSKPAKQPWPKTLADRIRAVEAALHAAAAPVTAADLSKHFTSTKPAALQEILESLAALGRARVDGEKFAV